MWRNKNCNTLTLSRPATFNTVWFQAPEWSTNHQHAPTPGNPVLMDIDASQKMQPLPFSYYQCGKAGHKAPDCPTQFDIWELSIDDLQTYLEDRLAELDAKHPEPTAEVEEQDFSCCNEWTACPCCHTTIVFLFYLHVQLMKKQLNHPVRGRSASSYVSSDISPSPLYIPPHRC